VRDRLHRSGAAHLVRDDPRRLAGKGKLNLDDGGEYVRAARKITATARWHERTIARVERAHDISAHFARSNELCNASADADYAVAGFTPRSFADLRCKLAFMVENDMGNGSDWLPDILADLDRFVKVEG
jgi:hypothetical protein